MSVIDSPLKLRNKEDIDINSNKDKIFELICILCYAFCGIAVTSAFFLILNEVPTFNFVLSSSVFFLISTVAFHLLKPKGGDDS